MECFPALCYATLMNSLNYRELLRQELDSRIADNPQYSLRALALQIKLSSAMLSLILSGKRNLSAKRALDISKALKFNQRKTDYFLALVQLDSAKSPEVKSQLEEKIYHLAPKSEAQKIDTDIFQMISDWHHLSILQMTRTTLPKPTKDVVAKYLGISTSTAEEAIDRLLRLELLSKDENGDLHTTKSQILSSASRPNKALRNYHRQMLEKATLSLESQTPQEKFIGSETFAFDAEDLEKASEIFEECFSKIVRLASTRKEKKHVYHVGIQMFRVTRDIT
jgi:uncharacterized protein (TIGR02147 family)